MKLLYVLLLLPLSVAAQNISGHVVDSDKQAVADVTISTPAGRHVHSDNFGRFEIGARVGDSLYFSKPGYRTIKTVAPETVGWVIGIETSRIELNEVAITNSIRIFNTISAVDLKQQPVTSSQELLRKVPGLFIGQHAGGGKAEQIFLRGFDIDHGTDIALDVDGIPVNMVSHGHGQGYADLHFVIPETVEKIDFDKGAYYTDKGNFTTAGYVSFRTRDILDQNVAGFELGSFNSTRVYGMFNLMNTATSKAYIASEYLKSDGPFISEQNFDRINIFSKYTKSINDRSQFSIILSHFKSQWDASGQIPERAVADGSIDWFGAIDDTEGGSTSRSNIMLQYANVLNQNTTFRSNVFYSDYNFELFSNFTFFLEDPVNGDQIRQKDSRSVFGSESAIDKHYKLFNNPLKLTGAVGFRNDNVNDVELSHTANRSIVIENIMLGDVNETNMFSYINSEFRFGKWLLNAGIRYDHFDFQYQDKLQLAYKSQSASKGILSPKLNIGFQAADNLNLYLKSGKGFHSNDTRVIMAQQGREILPATIGADLGLTWKPQKNLLINFAGWCLQMEQEFVYVGDAGIVEPSGESIRLGLDLGIRYSFLEYFYFNSDLNYTHGRSIDEPSGADYIPLAAKFTTVNGLSYQHPTGFSLAINSRYIADRPANEDNSIVAEGYNVTDFNAGYAFKNGLEVGVFVQNIFDVKWKETQFATESRLSTEALSVEEIHFTPGTPFNLRASLRYRF